MAENKEKIYQEIKQWFDSGCKINEGMKLHMKYSKNANNKKNVAVNLAKRKSLLRAFMLELLNIYKPEGIVLQTKTAVSEEKRLFVKSFEERLHEEFPKMKFSELSDTLKLLVYERFDAWETSKKQHALQHESLTDIERFEAAKATVEAIIKNWSIWEELDHFHKYGKPLGKHPKFEENDFISELRELEKLPVIEYAKELNLILRRMRNNINRILGIEKKAGSITENQKEVLNISIYKYDLVAEKLNEPKWTK